MVLRWVVLRWWVVLWWVDADRRRSRRSNHDHRSVSAAGKDVQMITGGTRQVSIQMTDGARLAATLYLPAQVLAPGRAGAASPVPCLLEALPYRKDDLTAAYRPEYVRFRDEHGYAVARVDLRGTGS